MLTPFKRFKCATTLATALMAVALISRPANAALMVSFNSTPVFTPLSSIIEDAGEITFANPTSADGNAFSVQDATWMSTLPDMTPGKVLTATTHSGNNVISYDLAFTMSFATPIDLLSMDMSYAVNPTAGGSIRLDGFDANGNLVASQNQTFYTNGVLEDHLTLAAGSTPISSVMVVPTAIAEGFGNIAYQTAAVPEPALVSLLAGIVFFPRRQKRETKTGTRLGSVLKL